MSGYKYPLLIFLLFFSNSCERRINHDQSSSVNILAKIGEKIITVNDFKKRSEYMPRPAYCKGDNYIHKKIAFNSLIAEKLLSLEFDDNNYIFTDTQKAFILGQKEQTMRHLMLKKFGYDSVKIDSPEINSLVKLSKRRYNISFCVVNKKHMNNIKKNLNDISINELKASIDDKIIINNKTLSKDDDMLEEIKQTLYFGKPKLNKMYGPFNIDIENVLYFEINEWLTRPNITKAQKKESFDLIQKEFIKQKALQFFSNKVSKIMKGRSIEYNPKVFKQFSEKLSEIYLIEKSKKENVIQNKIWELKENEEPISFESIKTLENKIILAHDNKNYTVQKLLYLIKTHPLVFRNKKATSKSFPKELKYAIADLFRDYHITQNAYNLNLHKNFEAINTESKWSDYIKSTIVKNNISNYKNNLKTPTNHLINKIDSLQNKYSDIIKIDTDKFEKIKLSKIDMSVMYSNQAYTKPEPSFPILTSDHNLDYGEKHVFK